MLSKSNKFSGKRRVYVPWKQLYWQKSIEDSHEQVLEFETIINPASFQTGPVTLAESSEFQNEKSDNSESYLRSIFGFSSQSENDENLNSNEHIQWKLFSTTRNNVCLTITIKNFDKTLQSDEICLTQNSEYTDVDSTHKMRIKLVLMENTASGLLILDENEQYISLSSDETQYKHQNGIIIGSENFKGFISGLKLNDAEINLTEDSFDGPDIILSNVRFPMKLELPCEVPVSVSMKKPKMVFHWYNSRNLLIRSAGIGLQNAGTSSSIQDSLIFNTTALTDSSLFESAFSGNTNEVVEKIECRIFIASGERTILRYYLVNSEFFVDRKTAFFGLISGLGDKDILTIAVGLVFILVLSSYWCNCKTKKVEDLTEEERPILNGSDEEEIEGMGREDFDDLQGFWEDDRLLY